MNSSKRRISIVEKISEVIHSDGGALLISSILENDSNNYFLLNPSKIITVSAQSDWRAALADVEQMRENGSVVLTLIDYEAGWLFEKKFKDYLANENQALITFLVYEKESQQNFSQGEIDYSGFDDLIKAGAIIRNFELDTSEKEFSENVLKIKKHIEEGDTYQVNYTVRGNFDVNGSLEALAAKMVFNQSGAFSAVINLNGKIIVSVSPELFFKTDRSEITVKPMKGTIERGINLEEDERNFRSLRNSRKDSAENVMIVDLLRNDIGKLCDYQTVEPDSMFDIEKLESVYQMTSTIRGKLKEHSLEKMLPKLFPCGSITGAPKIRTMEIIKKIEKQRRGIYTGSIGVAGIDHSVFNVAIRTIVIDKQSRRGTVGIGSGIVWDSDPKSEYDETLSKAKFLTEPRPYFELIETMLVENGDIFLLELHMERLRESAEFFLFKFPEDEIRSALNNEVSQNSSKQKFRLLLTKWGSFKIENTELSNSCSKIKVLLSERKVKSINRFQYFKTTNRSFYNEQFQFALRCGYDEVIFLNENDNLTEGAVSNIVIEQNGVKYTPPVDSGILNGCMRAHLIADGELNEKKLSVDDLPGAERIFVVNSVRKIREVTEIRNEIGDMVYSRV